MTRAAESLPAAPPSAPGRKGALLLLLGALTMFGPLSIDMYLPALPAIGRDLSAAATQTSVSAFLAGMAIGQFFYGAAADRFGRRPPLLFGLGLYVLASVGCAMAASYEMLVWARLLQALGACAGAVIARAIVRDRFGHTESARVLSLMMMISGVAPIVAPLLGGLVLAIADWRTIFFGLAAFGAAMFVLAFVRLPETRSDATAQQALAESPLRAYGALLSNRRFVGYALAGGLNGATLFTYVASSPELIIGFYQIPAAHFGWVFSANAVGLMAGGSLNRRLLKRRTPDQVLRVSGWVTAAVTAMMLICALSGLGGRWGMLGLLFLMLSSYGLLQGNTMAGALNLDPLRGGSGSALMGGLSFAVGAAASVIAALAHDGTPVPMAVVMAVSSLGSALALVLLALPKRRMPGAGA